MSTAPLLQVAPPLPVSEPAAVDLDHADPAELVGRRPERRTLDELVDTLRSGGSAALVVRGDAGVGKTALLGHLARHAAGCRIARVSAAPAERDLPHAALNQLCRPMLDRTERLPEPQRAALRTAFGLAAGAAPDRLFLGLAVLSLMAAAAEDRPLVCLVDDAHRLDAASSAVLGFVARRLAAERVAFVFAAREPVPDLAGLPELSVTGLAGAEARALLARTLRGPLDERVRERLIAEACGNPRTLLAVAGGSQPAGLAGGFGEPVAGVLAGRIGAGSARRLRTLTDEARLLLLIAASEPLGEPLLLWRAAEELGVPPTAADAAEEAGLLEIDTRVRFRHPTMRAAVYRSARPGDRRRVHRALAAATDAQTDPERRAWHRACGASAPDDAIASDLERSAARAAARGGLAAAAAFLRRAAALTPDPAARARRALAAAEATRRAGDPDGAMQVLVTAEAAPLDALGRACADVIRARVASDAGADDAAVLLHRAARRLEELDVDRAREAYLDALGAVALLGPRAAADPVAIARDALGARRAGPPRAVDLLLDGLALQLTEGAAAATPTLRRALAAFDSDDVPADVLLGWGWIAAYVAAARWEHTTHRSLAERLVRLSRQDGALATLPHSLAQLVAVRMLEGDLTRAAALMREAQAAVAPTGREPSASVETLMAAYRGREAEGRSRIEGAAQDGTGAPGGIDAVVAQVAGLILFNGLGRYEDALRVGRPALDDPEPVGAPVWSLPELVEAATRAGAPQEALIAMRALSSQARICGTDWALGLEARSRALLSRGREAERLHREAICRLASPGSRLDLARARLLYGEWLRREGRRVDARTQLRHAHEELTEMGFEAFADRAHRELGATGDTVRKRTTQTRDELTAQERNIAQLARDGLSNPEIGARLFLSPRTVEWHLRKIFAKLDISSRLALRDALPS